MHQDPQSSLYMAEIDRDMAKLREKLRRRKGTGLLRATIFVAVTLGLPLAVYLFTLKMALSLR